MPRTPQVLVVAAACLVLALPACGNNRSAQSDTGASATPSSRPKAGVILPETATSARWTQFDEPMLRQALQREGLTPVVQNAQGDAQKFSQIADSMLSQRVKVLIIAAPSSDAGAAVEQKAQQQGVPVIGYDRLSVGGNASYYVSFDHEMVGELQGRALSSALRGRRGAQVIEIGGSLTDNNATLVHRGQEKALEPLYGAGNVQLVNSRFVAGWNNQTGGQVFEQMLTANGGRVDGVLAANDGLAGAVITVLQKYGLAGRVPVTGQDTTVDGIRAILRGQQYSTVFKPIQQEAAAAARLAAALVRGDPAAADGMAAQSTRDPQSGRDVRSILLVPQLITRDNIKAFVGQGHLRASEICDGDLATTCQQLDLAR